METELSDDEPGYGRDHLYYRNYSGRDYSNHDELLRELRFFDAVGEPTIKARKEVVIHKLIERIPMSLLLQEDFKRSKEAPIYWLELNPFALAMLTRHIPFVQHMIKKGVPYESDCLKIRIWDIILEEEVMVPVNAFIYASNASLQEIVEFLISIDVDIDAKTQFGSGAMDFLYLHSHEIVNMIYKEKIRRMRE